MVTTDVDIFTNLREDREFVCGSCGTIYGLDKLIFREAEFVEPEDEFDIILKDFFRVDLKTPLATYECPNCHRLIIIPDRRQR